MSSTSGVHMSCLLHLWGGMDWRVRPLVTVVRRWARANKLVKDVRPTNFFTNFTLTMLVVCYLQQHHHMLPSFSDLLDRATEEDEYLCQDGVDVNFLHNITGHKEQLNQCYHSDVSLLQLLGGFFQFYSSYCFTKTALCPRTGSSRPKDSSWKHSSALDIYNPLEPQLNVSYNVNSGALRAFQEECRVARGKVDLLLQGRDKREEVDDGLFCIFDDQSRKRKHHKDSPKFVLPSIDELFEPSNELSKIAEKQTVEPVVDNPVAQNVSAKDKINVRSLFSTSSRKRPNNSSSERQKSPSLGSEKSSKETARVEQLKAKYLRSGSNKNFKYKL